MRVPSSVIGRVRPQGQDSAKSIQVPGISPDTFGADIGRATVGLGGAIAGAGAQLMDRDTQFERFDALQKLSEFETRVSEKTVEVQRTARPDGTDVPDRVKLVFDQEEQEYLKNINPRLQEEMKVRTANTRQKLELNANNFKNTAQDAHVTQSVQDELSRAKTLVNQDPEKADEALGRLREMISASPLPPLVKQQQLRTVEVELRKVEGQRRIANGQYNELNADPTPVIDYVTERIKTAESSGDPNAKSTTTSATGLGGFTSDTWLEIVKRTMPEFAAGKSDPEILAWRTDPDMSDKMIRALTSEHVKTFRQNGIPATPTNLYLAHFLGINGALRAVAADPAASVKTFIGAESLKANPAVFDKVKTQADLVNWAQSKMGTAADPKQPAVKLELKQDQNGYWTGAGVEYDLSGKTRSLPVSREYVEKVVPAVKAVDSELSIKITSAGQEGPDKAHPFLGKRVGSHRHDVDAKGESGTSDFVLMKNGKPILPEENKELYAKVMENLAAQGFTGIGHYKWGIHVGGGSKAAWGPSTTSADLDPTFKRAIERGWARASDRKVDAFDTDLRYANVPYEDRVLMRQAAQKDVQALVQQEAQQRQAQQQQFFNNLMNSIMDGKAGQKEVDAAYQSGMLSDFKLRKQAQDLLERTNTDAQLAAKAALKLGTPGAIWDPTSSEDRNMLNATLRVQKGTERIAAGDRDYFTNTIVPMVRQASDIPTELIGTLMGMVRSNNVQTALYAVDALAQLQKVDQRAFDHRVPGDLQRDVEYFVSRRGTKADAELLNEINGGSTFEEMQIKANLRKQAKDMLTDKVGGKVVEELLQKSVIAPYNGWFTSKPDTASLRWAGETMMNEARAIFVDEFVREKDVNKAVEATAKLMQKNWGISEINDKKVMMKHPPEKVGYKPYGGDYRWIAQSVRSELKLDPLEKFELLSDGQTDNEVERFKRDPSAPPPSYMMIITDKNGKAGLRMKTLPDGREVPYRMNFKPTEDLVSYLIDRDDFQHKIEVKKQEIREIKSFLLFDNADDNSPAAVKELRSQLKVHESELARLLNKAPLDPRTSQERAFEDRMRELGNQSTAPSMRK